MNNPFADFERNAFSPERNMPKLEGFDEYSALSGAEVKGILKELIPSRHLEGCPSITCNPNHPLWAKAPEAGGAYSELTHGIILPGREAIEAMGESEISIIFHEIGHNAHRILRETNPQAAVQWSQLHQNALNEYDNSGFGFVSDYAQANDAEDFAESYKTYIENPMLLEFMSPEKYEFMEQYVYDGREYGHAYMDNGQSVTLEKSIADALRDAFVDAGAGDEEVAIAIGGNHEAVSDTFRCFQMIG